MRYFSYGSNMSSRRILQRVSSAQLVTVACLKAHTLQFHKAGKDGSAKCDISFTSQIDDFVLGVVFDIAQEQKLKLDRVEGVGHGYEEKMVVVSGINGEEISASTYYATNINQSLMPYSWYKEHVMAGARENALSPDYVRGIEQVATIEDLDRDRHDREMSIYRYPE